MKGNIQFGLLLSLAAATCGEAAVINGGFETAAFPPWTFTGGAGVASGAFGTPPAGGLHHALMETGPSVQSSMTTIETFLGVPGGSITAFHPNPPGHPLVEGSAIRQTGVSIGAGQSVTFDFNFLTDEATGAGGVSDTAFWTLSSTPFTGVFFLADPNTSAFAVTSFTRFSDETGYASVNSGPLPAGTYTIGFGVADYAVTTVDSGLLIDNVAAIPEPATSSLVLTLAGITLLHRRRCQIDPQFFPKIAKKAKDFHYFRWVLDL